MILLGIFLIGLAVLGSVVLSISKLRGQHADTSWRSMVVAFVVFVGVGSALIGFNLGGELGAGGLAAREVVLNSQADHKPGDYRALYSAPLAGGQAVVSAGTPQGLDGVALASYWVGSGQAYAINSLALSLSPGLPGYDDLPVTVAPGDLFEVVAANN